MNYTLDIIKAQYIGKQKENEQNNKNPTYCDSKTCIYKYTLHQIINSNVIGFESKFFTKFILLITKVKKENHQIQKYNSRFMTSCGILFQYSMTGTVNSSAVWDGLILLSIAVDNQFHMLLIGFILGEFTGHSNLVILSTSSIAWILLTQCGLALSSIIIKCSPKSLRNG